MALLQATLFDLGEGSPTRDQVQDAEDTTSTVKYFCEVVVNGEYAGVTSSQKIDSRIILWQHSFQFTELSELRSIQVNLKRETNFEDSTLLGTCYLDARHWRRGIQHIGHLTICECRQSLDGHCVSMGEIKYKCKLEESVFGA